jgi:hypothetical protein
VFGLGHEPELAVDVDGFADSQRTIVVADFVRLAVTPAHDQQVQAHGFLSPLSGRGGHRGQGERKAGFSVYGRRLVQANRAVLVLRVWVHGARSAWRLRRLSSALGRR